ncbi:MAG TPA: c-type cytochrome [Chitinophagaceae bacterium]|nr:c-type cytochrome [Chitinophagaceae bacterium]
MRKQTMIVACLTISIIAIVIACNQPSSTSDSSTSSNTDSMSTSMKYGGSESQVKWGEHLVNICACNDCHTPKKMGPSGPENDSSMLLSGHPAQMPAPPVDRKTLEAKGVATTQTLTAWTGPWGISYAANLTPDSRGIGSWKEEQFMKAIREGKFKGLDSTRPLLPPTPWPSYRNFNDDELKAIFAYLKSIKPIHNVVPNAAPPVTAMK